MDEKRPVGKIMKAYLSIGTIPATVKDIILTNETLKDHGASHDGGEWRTRLWGKQNRKYRNFINACGQARTYLKQMSLETGVRGERVIKTTAFMDIKHKMKMLEERYWDTANQFIDGYDDMVAIEQARLAKLSINVNFPTKEQIAKKFRFDLWFGGIPEGDELIRKYGFDLPYDEVHRIAKEAEEKTKDQIAKAMLEAWRRVFNTVYDMAVKLSNEDIKFRDSLVGNIRSLVSMMPHLNITDDPQLETIRKEIEEKLLAHSSTEIKKDKEVREKVAQSALDITKQMATFFGDANDNTDK